jgi:hypothetical protein
METRVQVMESNLNREWALVAQDFSPNGSSFQGGQ